MEPARPQGKESVYLWVDGIHINVRLDDERKCLLMIIGATREGTKVLLALGDSYRESKANWRELLLDLKHRGLQSAGKPAIGGGTPDSGARSRRPHRGSDLL